MGGEQVVVVLIDRQIVEALARRPRELELGDFAQRRAGYLSAGDASSSSARHHNTGSGDEPDDAESTCEPSNARSRTPRCHVSLRHQLGRTRACQYAYSASYAGNCFVMLSWSSFAIAWNPVATA